MAKHGKSRAAKPNKGTHDEDLWAEAVDISEKGGTDKPAHEIFAKLAAKDVATSSNADKSSKKPPRQEECVTREELMRTQASDLGEAIYVSYQSALQCQASDLDAEDFITELAAHIKEANLHYKTASVEGLDALAQEFLRLKSTASAYRQVIEGPTIGKVLDSWEDGDEGDVKPPNEDVQKLLLEGISVAFPFQTDKVDYEAKASHPTLNASRVVASTMLYMKAAKACRKWATANPGRKSVVMDVGAGAFGAERIQLLKQSVRNANIYIHAMMPEADAGDTLRLSRFRNNPNYSTYNYVAETFQPKLGVLNYCHHMAKDCTCLSLYDHIEPVAIHAAYYFEYADYENLFSHPGLKVLHMATHVPKVGEMFPLQKPEFRWQNATEVGSWLAKAKAKYKELVTGVPWVAMVPEQVGERMYTHEDIGVRLRAGGFHVGPMTSWADKMRDVEFAFTQVTRAAALAAVSGFVTTPGGLATRLAGSLVSGTTAALGTVVAAAVEHRRSTQVEPPLGTDHTITFCVTQSYQEAANQEEIFYMVGVRKENPQTLAPQCLSSTIIDEAATAHATQSLLIGGTSEKHKRGVCASLIRDRVPLHKVKAAITMAVRRVDFLSQGEPAPPPDLLPRFLVATVTLPFASAAAHWSRSILIAALKPHIMRSPVGVLLRLINMPVFWIATIFLTWINMAWLVWMLVAAALVRSSLA